MNRSTEFLVLATFASVIGIAGVTVAGDWVIDAWIQFYDSLVIASCNEQSVSELCRTVRLEK